MTNIETMIASRLKLPSIQRSLYNKTQYDIFDLKSFKEYIFKHWKEDTEGKQNFIIQTLVASYSGKNKNRDKFLQYIEKILSEKYEIR